MSKPATMQDVADQAGVHRSTVSLALRNNPRISAEVRARVQRIAAELGYRPNPMVTALMRSRRTRRQADHGTLAYVTNYPTRYGWRPPHHDRLDYFPSAEKRAIELGYKLEHFWLRDPGMTPERFGQILHNRGISGVLIGRLPPFETRIDLPWAYFSSVALGLSLRTPRLNLVAEDAFASAAVAMRACLDKGYRRIGFAFTEPNDSAGTGDRYLAAYLRYQLHLDAKDRIPHFEYTQENRLGADLVAWMEHQQPDAIVATHAEPIVKVYRSGQTRFPAQVNWVPLANDKLEQGFAGIYRDADQFGSLAVDMVVGMLHRDESGIPRVPHRVLVPGVWVDGDAAKLERTLAAGVS